MTCEENLSFFGRMHGLGDVGGRVTRVLNQVGLEGRRNQRVRTLSHGMQKRLAMARAVLHDPPILLMDEAESGLDQGALEGMESLRAMDSGRRRTIIAATHNMEWGLGWGESVAVLRGGGIAYEASRGGLDEGEFRRTYGVLGAMRAVVEFARPALLVRGRTFCWSCETGRWWLRRWSSG